jgi:hypothetical protein
VGIADLGIKGGPLGGQQGADVMVLEIIRSSFAESIGLSPGVCANRAQYGSRTISLLRLSRVTRLSTRSTRGSLSMLIGSSELHIFHINFLALYPPL